MIQQELMTTKEVAAYLRVHPDSVRRWLRAGVLSGARLGRGGAYRVDGGAVRDFVADRMGKPTLRRRPVDRDLLDSPHGQRPDPAADR